MGTVLIISPESWSHIFVSKHHYALELSRRGYRVFFLNPPSLGTNKELQVTQIQATYPVTVIDYRGQMKGLRFLPAAAQILINQRFLARLERTLKTRIDIIWNFENSRFYDFRFAGKRLAIYHQVDLNQDFHVERAASTSDICFCTTDFILSKLLGHNRKTFKIHHGVPDAAFTMNGRPSAREGGEVIATLVGNIDSFYLDIELLDKIVSTHPTIKFVLVGSYDVNGQSYRQLAHYPNVVFAGKVESAQIPGILSESNILIVCYRAAEFREQLASPHKIMEYLASGKVIVATYTDEYKDKENLLVMSDSADAFVANFRKVADQLEHYNAAAMQSHRIEFARRNTYSKQVATIFELLQQHVPGKHAVLNTHQ